ncbi:iron donor protein CyaY [Frischella perrara]|uniref:iron donor protein CyaY n=1 Tax=Frischella perrara TaxID=1267021 RepID=UPI0023F56D3F|nr:iron donor protein CyaY [Frischella perrara]
MEIKVFHQLADTLFDEIERDIDNFAEQFDTDIDFESHGNVITITFENNNKIIINTQEPLLQIWMATPQQGYHFENKEGNWICNRSGIPFKQLFSQSVINQIKD